MRNTVPKKSKEKPPQLVVVGLGLSGIDFLLGWQERFKELYVTVFERSGSTPFLLDALFLIKNKKLSSISGNESWYQMENFTFAFSSFSINSVDLKKNVLYHSGGEFCYDYLLIVNEFDLRIKLRNGHNFTESAFLNNSYKSDCLYFNEKKVVIEGHGMATMAVALKFLDYGFAPSIVCKNSRLAIGELPAEESWLFSKYFKYKGINLNFETSVEKYFTNETNDLIGVRITNGKEFLVSKVIVVADETPYFSFLEPKEYYSGTIFKTNNGHCILGYSNVYAVGEKIKIVTEEEGKLVDSTFLNGLDRLKSDNYPKYFSCKQFVFKELSWQTYGEISPEWGIDTQNFYWEHPSGDVSFRLHYKKEDFSIKGIACLGLSFNNSFMVNALQSNWKAHDFIDSFGEGLMQNEYSSKVCPLIKKSFGVEFKKVIKSYRSSLLKRIVKKLLS